MRQQPQSAPNVESPSVSYLRSRTDDLLRDIVIGNRAMLRRYFPPDVSVDVSREIRSYLQAPPGTTSPANWDAEAIGVTISPDGATATTRASAVFRDRANRSEARRVVSFKWQASGDMFYLVPQSVPASPTQ